MFSFIMCEAPPKNLTIFRPFFTIFTLFHLKNWPYLQKPEFGNLAKTRFWLLLVNNSLCSIPPSWARSEIKEIPGDRCVYLVPKFYLPHGKLNFLHLSSRGWCWWVWRGRAGPRRWCRRGWWWWTSSRAWSPPPRTRSCTSAAGGTY